MEMSLGEFMGQAHLTQFHATRSKKEFGVHVILTHKN